jgi:hypothetical protein
MARLPTKQDLGGLPSAKTGRPIASYDVTAVGKGVQDLGRAVSGVSKDIERAASHVDPAQEFEAERRFQEFKWNQKLNLDETMRSVEPGQADGFANRWVEGYSEGAKEFLSTVPAPLKGKYDNKLFSAEREFYGSASTFARGEQKRVSLNQIEDVKNTYGSRAQAGEPLDGIRTDFESLVGANPFLTAIEKDEAIRKGYSGLEESHVLGRIERGDNLSEILKDLHGGQPDTDENPEIRARPFSRPTSDRKPVSQFDAGINDAINAAAEQNDVDPGILATFAQIESSGRAGAKTGSYKGLFQLSDAEFRKHGGEGSIYDPVANANAAARKLKVEAETFEAAYGRAPSVLDLYMVHQQGEGGYAAHMANPERPAWENMASTGEGREKGDKWAKMAIWGNIPKDVRKRFPGGVESVTSADFVEMWGEKVRRIGGVDAAPASDDTNVVFLGPYRHLPSERRRTLIEKAKIASRTKATQDTKDSIEEIRNEGVTILDENGENALERAERVLTRKQFTDLKADWQEAELEYQAFNDINSLTEPELDDRLRETEPKVGEELYQIKSKLYDKALKEVEKIRTLREKDPASAVSDLPGVQEAEQGIRENPGDPQFVQALAAARIDAQAKVGIPEGLQSPITKQESRVVLAPTRGLEGDALYKSLEEVQGKLEEQYGPYARVAAAKAFEYDGRSKETAEELAGFVDGLFKGEKISASQIRRLEFLNETDLATRAFGGDFVGDPVRQYQGRPEGPETGMPVQVNPANAYRMRKPPKAAIDALQANPQLRDQFDAHYGSGSADRVLVQ